MSRKCLIVRNNLIRKSYPNSLRNFTISFLTKKNCLDFDIFFKTYIVNHNNFSLNMSNLLKEKSISFLEFLQNESLCKEKDLNEICKLLKKRPTSFLDMLKFWSASRKKRRYNHINRVTNRCNTSGRKNSISLLGICRVQVREFHALGKIPGLLKF